MDFTTFEGESLIQLTPLFAQSVVYRADIISDSAEKTQSAALHKS